MRLFKRITLALTTVVGFATLTGWAPDSSAQALSAPTATPAAAMAPTATVSLALAAGLVQDPPPATSGAAPSAQAPTEVLPLSMRPFYHVFAAFGLAWLLIFGYAVSVRRRLASLEREVERLTR
jgi:CcmD family protein